MDLLRSSGAPANGQRVGRIHVYLSGSRVPHTRYSCPDPGGEIHTSVESIPIDYHLVGFALAIHAIGMRSPARRADDVNLLAAPAGSGSEYRAIGPRTLRG